MSWDAPCPHAPHATVGAPGGIMSCAAHVGHVAMRLRPSACARACACADDAEEKSGCRIAPVEEGARGARRRDATG